MSTRPAAARRLRAPLPLAAALAAWALLASPASAQHGVATPEPAAPTLDLDAVVEEASPPRPGATLEQVIPLSRPGHGQPVAGLGAAFHAGRRAALRAELGEGLVLLRGLPETPDYNEFHQDKTFWYLTGVESPDAALLMDAASGEEILFVRDRDERKEGWEGELWDVEDEWVSSITGFDDVRSIDGLVDLLDERLADEGTLVWVSLHPAVALSGCFDRAKPALARQAADPLDGRTSREQALADNLRATWGAEVRDMADVLAELRRVKTDEELAALRRAGSAGARALAEVIRSTRAGLGEWDMDGLVGFAAVREGADGHAYHAIVGSGQNATTLHYSASTRDLHEGEILLVDAGPEVDHYVTDITRSWPVSGQFTDEQAELYDAVLAAQEAGIAATRPGATMREVNDIANGVLRERGFGHLIKHGVCHYVGMEVHDPGRYDAPFEPGVVITVEPGLYDAERGIGIRIEDVVVVTPTGCDVITREVPVTREALEALIAEEGVLDWMDGSTAEE